MMKKTIIFIVAHIFGINYCNAENVLKTLDFTDEYPNPEPTKRWAKVENAAKTSASDLTFCLSMLFHTIAPHHILDSLDIIT